MSLLTAVQNACQELNLPAPTQVIGNTDAQVIQLLALANREGAEFSADSGQWGGWPEQVNIYTFNLVPAGPFTGNVVAGSTVITNIVATGVQVGYGVSGPGTYQSATVTAVDLIAQTVTMSAASSSTETGGSFQFGQIAYPLPSDFSFFIPATWWDRNFRWPMLGPLSAQEWETVVSGISPVGPRIRFRVFDNQMVIQPLPGESQTDQIAYEYISNSWCKSSGGTPRAAVNGVCQFANDSDVYLWPENTLTLGIKWRFLAAKGLNYAEERNTWENACNRQKSRSGSTRSLRLNAQARGIHLLGYSNIPDSGFGYST